MPLIVAKLWRVWFYIRDREWEDRVGPVERGTVFGRGDTLLVLGHRFKVVKAGTQETAVFEYRGPVDRRS